MLSRVKYTQMMTNDLVSESPKRELWSKGKHLAFNSKADCTCDLHFYGILRIPFPNCICGTRL